MLRLSLPALAFVLLGAHFFRIGALPGTLVCIALTSLLLVPHRWVPRIASVGLGLGTLEWLRTLYGLASARAAMDLPWSRLAAILGAVAFFTALSTLVFGSRRVRGYYGLE